MSNKQIISISTFSFLKALIIIIIIGLIYLIWDILLLFLIALLLAALIVPLADWGKKKKIPRGLTVLIVYTLFLGVVGGLIALLVPPIIAQATQLIDNLGIYSAKIISSLNTLKNLGVHYGVWDNFSKLIPSTLQTGWGTAGKVMDSIFGFFGGVSALILILVIAFYVVVEEDNFKKIVYRFLPADYHSYFSQLWSRMKEKLGFWLRGQLLLNLIVGAMVYIGLLLLGVPYALLLGVLAGLFETIPYAGPFFSAVVAVLLTFLQTGDWFKPLLVMILFIVIQQLENNLIVPKIMQKAVGIDPIISILSLLVGYRLLGVPGALLAIPLVVVLSVVWSEILEWKSKKA